MARDARGERRYSGLSPLGRRPVRDAVERQHCDRVVRSRSCCRNFLRLAWPAGRWQFPLSGRLDEQVDHRLGGHGSGRAASYRPRRAGVALSYPMAFAAGQIRQRRRYSAQIAQPHSRPDRRPGLPRICARASLALDRTGVDARNGRTTGRERHYARHRAAGDKLALFRRRLSFAAASCRGSDARTVQRCHAPHGFSASWNDAVNLCRSGPRASRGLLQCRRIEGPPLQVHRAFRSFALYIGGGYDSLCRGAVSRRERRSARPWRIEPHDARIHAAPASLSSMACRSGDWAKPSTFPTEPAVM